MVLSLLTVLDTTMRVSITTSVGKSGIVAPRWFVHTQVKLGMTNGLIQLSNGMLISDLPFTIYDVKYACHLLLLNLPTN